MDGQNVLTLFLSVSFGRGGADSNPATPTNVQSLMTRTPLKSVQGILMPLPFIEKLTMLMPPSFFYRRRIAEETRSGEPELAVLAKLVPRGGTAIDIGASRQAHHATRRLRPVAVAPGDDRMHLRLGQAARYDAQDQTSRHSQCLCRFHAQSDRL